MWLRVAEPPLADARNPGRQRGRQNIAYGPSLTHG
jgi:hypothetical protein